MTDRLMIIADDYGLGPGHDAVMRALLSRGAIHAVSVLVDHCSPESARLLAPLLDGGAKAGLHFDLTLPGPQNPGGTSRNLLLLGSLAGLGRRRAAGALDHQWRRFFELFGRPPDFIDGHEHCHSFPGIREPVLTKAAATGTPVRAMVLMRKDGLKARVLDHLGRRVRARARAHGVRTNDRFGGVLPLNQPDQAIAMLEAGLSEAAAHQKTHREDVWFMVHPGDPTDSAQVEGHPAILRGLEADLLFRLRDADE